MPQQMAGAAPPCTAHWPSDADARSDQRHLRMSLQLASGVEWEDGMYLPRAWQPFCPYTWLADYIMARHQAAGQGGSMQQQQCDGIQPECQQPVAVAAPADVAET